MDEQGTVGNAGIREHGTDFIHRPVGTTTAGWRCPVHSGLLHHEAQGTRGLSGARRTHQQKVVLGSFLFQDDSLKRP